MERILDLNAEFDVKLFDQIVATALNPSAPNKSAAEAVLLQFKDLPNSWTKIDCILKSSHSKQSHFIALQILEETVKSKWVLFGDDMKAGLRQYVFSTVIEQSGQPLSTEQHGYPTNIVLQKFNSILVEIVKKDWPRRWPTFITDLINVSQTTSMQVSMNSLVILKSINEQIFIVEDDITTTKKRILKRTLQQEYTTIFQFISLILEYSETHELDDSLLENCLNAFKSFCRSMSPEYIFSTQIVDYILGHLNSPHSIATLECILEITELKKTVSENINVELSSIEVTDSERQKLSIIHSELLKFFKLYLSKFQSQESGSKLYLAYKNMDEKERMFVKKYAAVFSSLYSNWIYELNQEQVKEGLGYLIQLSKISDQNIFKETFGFWAKFIYEMYSEYPLRIPTTKPLKRNSFAFALETILPVFVDNMPRPEEVFILVNDLGEVVKNKMVETAEIEFYKKMKSNLFYLSFCIESFMIGFFEKKIGKFLYASGFDHDQLNKLCWAMGSFSNALEESVERDFFVLIIKNLLSICEMRNLREEKEIIASNIMFVIGQYQRFLKYHQEFMMVVIKKLFEFMGEKCEGIKEMACDNFYKICEKCPNQFFMKKGKTYFFENVLNDLLPSARMELDYYLQRIVIEGLLIVIKNSQKKDKAYIETIYSTLTNQNMLDERYITSIHTVIHEPAQLKMTAHLIESYSLGFKILPEIFHEVKVLNSFLIFYRHISDPQASFNKTVSKNIQILKTTLTAFFEAVIVSGYMELDYLNNLCECVILDFKTSFDPAILSLASSIVSKTTKYEDSIEVQRLQFFISNLISPSVPYIMKTDEHIELSKKYLALLNEMISKSFITTFSLLVESPSFEAIVNSVLFSLTGIREVSQLALTTLKILFRSSLENKIFVFFNRFFLICLENVLGLIFDKDMRQNYDLQVELLYDLMGYVNRIPSLNNTTNNYVIVREFVTNLFTKNFRNLTEGSVGIFIEGVFEIKNFQCFKDHLDDFNVKIYEYGSDEDLQDELDLLKERIAVGN